MKVRASDELFYYPSLLYDKIRPAASVTVSFCNFHGLLGECARSKNVFNGRSVRIFDSPSRREDIVRIVGCAFLVLRPPAARVFQTCERRVRFHYRVEAVKGFQQSGFSSLVLADQASNRTDLEGRRIVDALEILRLS